MQAYRETDEGRAECAEVIGRLGSWKSHLKETERFKYLSNVRAGIEPIPHKADLPAKPAPMNARGQSEDDHNLQGHVGSADMILATLGKS